MPKRFLALDPGRACGWAYTRGGYGVWQLPKATDMPGIEALDLYRRILAFHADQPFDAIGYERLMVMDKQRGREQQHAKQSAILMAAADLQLPCYGYWPTALKKRFGGHGRAEKDRMAEVLRERWGIDCREHDAVDAIIVLWACTEDHG